MIVNAYGTIAIGKLTSFQMEHKRKMLETCFQENVWNAISLTMNKTKGRWQQNHSTDAAIIHSTKQKTIRVLEKLKKML